MVEAQNRSATQPTDQEFVITRVFDAPHELVFAAFTESERMKQITPPMLRSKVWAS